MRKGFWIIFVIIIGGTVLQFPLQSDNSSRATLVWSDDFDDGNFDGWTVRNGNFTAEEYTLMANATQGESDIYINSTVTTGTWQWIMHNKHPENASQVFFIHGHIQLDITAYSIQLDPQNQSFSILKWKPNSMSDWNYNVLDSYYTQQKPNGSQQIIITRDISGFFYVWINDTFRMSAIDDKYETSDVFRFTGYYGSAIDNIIISDTIDRNPESADLRFTIENATVICEPGNDTRVTFDVLNHGEAYGSATLQLNPDLQSVGIFIDNIYAFSNPIKFNETDVRRIGIYVDSACLPGIYETDLEMWGGGPSVQTIHLTIIVPLLPFNPFSQIPPSLVIVFAALGLECVIVTLILSIEFYLRKRKEPCK